MSTKEASRSAPLGQAGFASVEPKHIDLPSEAPERGSSTTMWRLTERHSPSTRA